MQPASKLPYFIAKMFYLKNISKKNSPQTLDLGPSGPDLGPKVAGKGPEQGLSKACARLGVLKAPDAAVWTAADAAVLDSSRCCCGTAADAAVRTAAHAPL